MIRDRLLAWSDSLLRLLGVDHELLDREEARLSRELRRLQALRLRP